MPDTAGNCSITVAIDDGNGGQDEKTKIVEVLTIPSVTLSQISGGGYITEETSAIVTPCGTVGDAPNNKPVRGFLSFGISSLTGKTVMSAEMKFNHYGINNDPYSLIEKIRVEAVYWGTDDIELGDYNLAGVILGVYDIPIFTCSSTELIDVLNQAITDGHDRFQVRLSHKGYQTDHDSIPDIITYGSPVEFTVSYMP